MANVAVERLTTEIDLILNDQLITEETRDGLVQDLLNKKCHKVKMHAPHLDENLRPAYELFPGVDNPCPHKDLVQTTECRNCEFCICFISPEDGIFAHSVFDGYCAKLDEELDK